MPGWTSWGRSLPVALERAEEEGRRSRIFGELAGSIDLDEVLSPGRSKRGGALPGADAALLMLPDPQGGKPLVATLGLSSRRRSATAITGPPDGRLAPLDHDVVHLSGARATGDRSGKDGIIHAGLAVPLPGETLARSGTDRSFTRAKGHQYSDERVSASSARRSRCAPARRDRKRPPLPRGASERLTSTR